MIWLDLDFIWFGWEVWGGEGEEGLFITYPTFKDSQTLDGLLHQWRQWHWLQAIFWMTSDLPQHLWVIHAHIRVSRIGSRPFCVFSQTLWNSLYLELRDQTVFHKNNSPGTNDSSTISSWWIETMFLVNIVSPLVHSFSSCGQHFEVCLTAYSVHTYVCICVCVSFSAVDKSEYRRWELSTVPSEGSLWVVWPSEPPRRGGQLSLSED